MVKTITRSKVIGFWCLDFKLAAKTAAKELPHMSSWDGFIW